MDFMLVVKPDAENTVVGDMKLTNGQFTLTPDLRTAVAQHIVIRLLFFFGEWFLDAREGMPWFELILIKNPDLTAVTNIFRDVIVGTPGVATIARINLDLDRTTRVLRVTQLEIKLTDGTTLKGSDFGPLLVYAQENTNAGT